MISHAIVDTIGIGIIEIPMSHFNRIQCPICECTAVISIYRGTARIVHDEPETRQYKDFVPLIPPGIMNQILNDAGVSTTFVAG
jgi:hypothetical protein